MVLISIRNSSCETQGTGGATCIRMRMVAMGLDKMRERLVATQAVTRSRE